jgi:hypothetical protein
MSKRHHIDKSPVKPVFGVSCALRAVALRKEQERSNNLQKRGRFVPAVQQP